MMRKVKMRHKILSSVLALLMVFTSFPMASVYAAEGDLGEISVLSSSNCANIENNNQESIIVSYNKSFELDWSPADTSIGRTKDGWWAGIKMTAPEGMDVSSLTNAIYQSKSYTSTDWSVNKSFWSNKDSADDATEHFITLWAFVNEENLNDALSANENIETSWRFDWDNDGVIDQTVTTKINPSLVVLNKDNKQVYPSANLGSVTGITGSPKIENDKSNSIKVSYDEEVTLQWSQADSTVGRNKDGWWAGIKMTAPEDMDVSSLTNAIYQSKSYTSTDWSVNKSFWSNKDSADDATEHFITLWAYVNEDIIALENTIKTQWRFDWDNDGVYEQYVVFSLDAACIELDPTNFLAMDKSAPVISGLEDSEKYTNNDISVEFNVADGATESNGVNYTSGISGVYFSSEKLTDVTVENIKKLETANKIDDSKYSFTVNNDTNKRYYIYAIDNSNNITEADVLVQVDKTAPVFNENPVVDTDEWTSNDVTIKGKISDNLSGIVDEKNFTVTADAEDVKFTYNSLNEKEGEYTITIPAQTFVGDITVCCVDEAGNKSTQKFSLQMDKTNCVIMSLKVSESDWTNSNVVISGTVEDSHSGVKEVTATLDGAYKEEPEVEYINGNYTITVPAQNYSGTLTVNAIDKVGNNNADKDNSVASLSVNLKMDNTAPVVESSSADKADWTNQNVTINGSIKDNLSGINAVYYAEGDSIENVTGSNISTKATPAVFNKDTNTYSFEIDAQNYAGNYVIYAVDEAGNISSAKTVAVLMDTAAPSGLSIEFTQTAITKILEGITFGFYNSKNADVIARFSATDPVYNNSTSGVSKFYYSINDGEYVTVETTGVFECKLKGEFKDTIKFKAHDKAGNVSAEYDSKSNDGIQGAISDLTFPVIQKDIEYKTPSNTLDNGKMYFNDDVKITFQIEEEHFYKEYEKDGVTVSTLDENFEVTVTKDGKEITDFNLSMTSIYDGDDKNTLTVTIPVNKDGSTDGDYLANVVYTDLSGNEVEEESEEFVIDTTAPVVEISYENTKNENRAGEGYFLNRTATITVEEHNFDKDAFSAAITAKDIEGNTISDTAAEKALAENQWEDNGDTHTLVIPYTDDANYTFALNSLQDLAKNDDYETKEENEGSIYVKGAETPDSFAVDKVAPSEVEITYSESIGVVEDVLSKLFWFYNPDNDAPCEVTLTTTDMTSGLQYFTYSYDGNDTVVTENTNGGEKQAQGWTQDENDLSKFTYTFTINPQFRGQVTASATDNAGNVTENQTISEKTIIVDNISAVMTAAYSTPANTKNGVDYYSDDVTVTLNVTDENFMDGEYPNDVRDIQISAAIVNENGNESTETYEVNNWARVDDAGKWKGTFVLSTEGDYTLTINYTDKSGNKAETYTKSNITIDKTAPVVTVEYEKTPTVIHTIDGRGYYNSNRSATITVVEHNFSASDFETKGILKAVDILGNEVTNYINYFKDKNNWSSEGNTHTIKVDFKSDANYTFDFTFCDLAKNYCDNYNADLFTIDKTAPKNLKVSYSTSVLDTVIGSLSFGFYDKQMTVTLSADDDTTGVYHFMYSYLLDDGVSKVNAQLIDEAIKNAKITLNGKTSVATFNIPKSALTNKNQFNGTVQFTAYDFAENNSFKEDNKRVVVDNISPTAKISYNNPVQNANNISYYAGDINATIEITEANFYSKDVEVIVSQNGTSRKITPSWTDNSVDKHTGTFTLGGDGDYIVSVKYSDRSGNKMVDYKSNQLTIDTVDPVITVSGINHQSANNGETIGFSISVTDKNIALSEFKPVLTAVIRNDNGELETINISLGDPVTSTNDKGETVYTYTVQNLSVDGYYSLTCGAVDYANHSVTLINSGQDNGTSANEEMMNFSVNREGSTFWIETTHNDKYTDKIFTNELDKAYANDNVEIVIHELNVDQVNISNNRDEETVFALHDGSSTGYVTLQEGSGANGNYIKNTLRGEGGWYETRYTLNNDNFAHDGVYSFSILSYDRAGNSNLNTKDDSGIIKFTVDRTNPVITSNISESQVIDADVYTVEFEINDTNHDKNTVEVTLNGKPVPSESITSLGGNRYSFVMSTGSKQSVSVTSKDLAGNTAEQYEVNDITVSTNRFVLFYYSHTLLFWIIVAGIVLLACLILFIVFRRKKDDDEEEEK